MRRLLSLVVLLAVAMFATPPACRETANAAERGRAAQNASPKLKLLFLGDSAGHQPKARFDQLQPVFAARGIALTYTDKLTDLNDKTLSGYDGLVVYANHTKIAPEQEKALLDYVAGGKALIPIHCASYCFLNSPAYVELVGAQFRTHTTGTFRALPVAPDHAIMKGYKSFTSWDETYVHTKHNEKDRTVLEVRAEGELKEPWTWVRTHGKGRVFYTAWGHDQRTWGHEGFHNLLERGVRWACNQDPAVAGTYFEKPDMTAQRKDVAPFEYVPAKVPFYAPKKGAGISTVPPNSMQKPLPVEESIKHYVTPVDFELKTFVTEDKLGGKPIAMTWDERGRLWLSITQDYPNEMQREGEGRDRIVVCEDANGDGVCDTATTFADKLSIPTSLLPYAGGLIVHQAPHTLFLKDTDGDGKADVRQVLFTGWSTGDTHAGPSNLHYGFDNWIYGAVGYAGYRGTVNGEALNFRQGFYRFKVEGGETLKVTKLEFLRSTNNNTWGLCFDEAGQLFGSTANGCPIVHMPIPNRYYEKARGLTASVLQNIAPDFHIEPTTEKIRQVDWHGGFTAASNIAIYTARTYPREYWNRTAFISEPTGHLTAAMTLHPSGADYKARYGWNIVASDDEWAAPIDAQVGPDGHVWVLDWYNFIVQHNPTPTGFTNGKGNAYETPLRDKKHGRVYRVIYTKAKAEPPFTLKDATPEKLVEALKHPNMTWRLHAQRLLVEKGAGDDLVRRLDDAVRTQLRAEEAADAPYLTHALWALHGLNASARSRVDLAATAMRALKHPAAAVRRAAAEVLAAELPRAAADFPLDALPAETDPQARTALLLALASARREGPSWVALIRFLRDRSPPNSQPSWWGGLEQLSRTEWDALVIAACAHDAEFLAYYPKAAYVFGQTTRPVADLVEATTRHFAARADAATLNRILEAALPNPVTDAAAADIARLRADVAQAEKAVADNPAARAQLQQVVDARRAILDRHLEPYRLQAACFEPLANGLAAGWPAGKPAALTPKAEVNLLVLARHLHPTPRGRLIRLASTWGVKGLDAQLAELTKGLFATVADAKAKDADRIDAAKQAIEFQPENDDAALKLLDAAASSPTVAGGILDALAASKSKALPTALVAKLKDLSPLARPAALRLALARPESTKAYLDAVEKGTLRFDMLALDQKTALASHPDKSIGERAKKLLALGGGLPSPDRQKVIDELKHVITKTGDVPNGKKMYAAHCGKCHKYAGEGEHIGPDLTGMAVHPKEEILIHILDPSRSVEGNYKAYRVVTADGRAITGLLASESKTAVEVIDAEAKRHPLQRDDIESLKETDKSLMPEGFEKQMKAEELADLLEYLTQKGKFVPLPLDKVATVVSTKDMFFDAGGTAERLVFPDWKPKTFNGVPFVLVDPQGEKVKNAVLLNGPQGKVPPSMPRSVSLSFNGKAKAIHLLSGVGGWNALQARPNGPVSMIVRLTYDDGKTEDHELRDGVHFADYIRRVDVPGSQFAFNLRGAQMRYLAVTPKRDTALKTIELVKGTDRSAPVVMALTVESP